VTSSPEELVTRLENDELVSYWLTMAEREESFYRKCTPEYTSQRLREIEEVRAWLLSRLRT